MELCKHALNDTQYHVLMNDGILRHYYSFPSLLLRPSDPNIYHLSCIVDAACHHERGVASKHVLATTTNVTSIYNIHKAT